ncbi:Copia protein, partial [Mucuna pruriens]
MSGYKEVSERLLPLSQFNSLVCWRSKKQFTVAKSSSEVKYRALGSATCELQWLHYLLQDLEVKCDRQSVIYCDNQSALHIVANLVFHERTKKYLETIVILIVPSGSPTQITERLVFRAGREVP